MNPEGLLTCTRHSGATDCFLSICALHYIWYMVVTWKQDSVHHFKRFYHYVYMVIKNPLFTLFTRFLLTHWTQLSVVRSHTERFGSFFKWHIPVYYYGKGENCHSPKKGFSPAPRAPALLSERTWWNHMLRRCSLEWWWLCYLEGTRTKHPIIIQMYE